MNGFILSCLAVLFLFVQTSFSLPPEKNIGEPKQRVSFFFGSKWMMYDYFGSEEVPDDLIEDILIENLNKSRVGYSLYGGFIDSDHLGESFLWAVYYQHCIYDQIMDKNNPIKLKMSQPSLFVVEVNYSSGWNRLATNQKEDAAKEISIELARYLAFNWSIYHEMLSWYGYKSTGFFSEFGSAFSPEDLYSDCLGGIIAAKTLRDGESFEKASVRILKSELEELGIQPVNVVKKAHKFVEKCGWWNGKSYPYNEVYMRNFDIGLDDGFITPMTIQSNVKDVKPKLLPVPKLPNKNGFSFRVRIECKEKESRELLKAAGKKDLIVAFSSSSLEPAVDYPKIMKVIVNESEKKLKY